MILFVLYGILLTLLFIYGLNIYYLTYLACRHRQQCSSPLSEVVKPIPFVTVQIPIYNERYVAQRVIQAVCQLDWPRDRLQIQVLDDSTDNTSLLIAETVNSFQAQGFCIQHIQRADRQGFKAGALAEALPHAQGVFIAIFDADFLPQPNFLRQMIPYLQADAEAAFIQARWGHLNKAQSLLTQLQAIAIDAHFAIEQYARYNAGFFFNFNGTAGIWRKEAIQVAGGWQADTLTEDLDLSYRAQLCGMHGIYLRDIVVCGEIPPTLNAFRRQQHRWARGSIECSRKLLLGLLRSHFPKTVKLQSILHLTSYGIQLLMTLVVLLYMPLLLWNGVSSAIFKSLYAITTVFTLTFFAPTLYLIFGQRELGKQWFSKAAYIVLLSLLGVGMMYHNAAAVLAAFLPQKTAIFERTPKYGDAQLYGANTYKSKLSGIVVFEAVMVVYNSLTLYLAFQQQNWSIVFFVAFFMMGLLFVLMLNLYQELQFKYSLASINEDTTSDVTKNNNYTLLLTYPEQ